MYRRKEKEPEAQGIALPRVLGTQQAQRIGWTEKMTGVRRSSLPWMIVSACILLAIFLVSMALVLYVPDSTSFGSEFVSRHQTESLRESQSATSPRTPVRIENIDGSDPPEKLKSSSPFYHVIFSTSCTAQQHWESYVFYYHAMKVHQPGNITRIASGCSEGEAQSLTAFHEKYISTMSERFRLHLTPDYSRIRVTHDNRPYKYMNKPFGVRHWMEHVLGMGSTEAVKGIEDDIVILMDPDMIFLKPLLHDFSKTNVVWAAGPNGIDDMSVRHGHPMAQQDGYLTSIWLSFNFSYITRDPNSPAYKIPHADGHVRYNAGPPYLATVRDLYAIATKWTEYAPRVHDVFPKLFAEMFGYCTAIAQLGLPHTMIKSIAVSTTLSMDREGWELVDAIPVDQICRPSKPANLPFVLHYCKRYLIGKFFFSKYRLRKDYLSCEAPLLSIPPENITEYTYAIWPPHESGSSRGVAREPINVSAKVAKREAFMLCGLISRINEAVEYFKREHCNGLVNFEQSYTFHDI